MSNLIPHPESCIYCKWIYLDNIERAQIRLTNKLPYVWTECLAPESFNKYDTDSESVSDFYGPCVTFEPCPEPEEPNG